MSSTDAGDARDAAAPDAADRLAGALWDEEVAPLAAALRARGVRFFETGPDPAAASYFTAPTHREMAAADFAFPGPGEELIDALAARWAAEGLPELAALSPRLRELAAELRNVPENEDPDVSPFVYTMY